MLSSRPAALIGNCPGAASHVRAFQRTGCHLLRDILKYMVGSCGLEPQTSTVSIL
jgi:hypothetical protein